MDLILLISIGITSWYLIFAAIGVLTPPWWVRCHITMLDLDTALVTNWYGETYQVKRISAVWHWCVPEYGSVSLAMDTRLNSYRRAMEQGLIKKADQELT